MAYTEVNDKASREGDKDPSREASLRLLDSSFAWRPQGDKPFESTNPNPNLFPGVKRGDDFYQIEYDKQGNVSKLTENINGQVSAMEAGKDFKAGDAVVNKDGSVTIKSPDGKQSYTLKEDFSCTTKVLGDKADGSADKIVRVRTKDGVQREIYYDPKTGEQSQIVDRLKTNSGKELVETTTRLGTSNVWNFESNYGRNGQRTNVVFDSTGNYTSNEIKRSRPNDLVDTDNSDGMHRDLVGARQHLAKLAAECGVFKGSEATVDAWCRKFEQRARDRAHTGGRAPTDAQMIKTYDYLERILKGSGNGLGATSRQYCVESALREYAEPNKYINQGSHPSCCLAATERHVVETMPDQHARVLYEMMTYKSVLSYNKDAKSGKYQRINFNDTQIKVDGEAASVGRGGNWGGAWSYSNKLFQIAAIKLSYPGYNGNGHGFPGAGIDQARRANRFITGESTIPLVDRWMGGKPSFSSLQNALKKGTVHYFVPGHAMSIDKAAVKDGVQYVHIDNWWGGSGDGWRQWSRV